MTAEASPIKTVWLVCGPTASGKTALAIQLAQHWQTVVVSADSRQVYQELNIGVARPSAEELAAVPHALIAEVSIQDGFTAGQFAKIARAKMEEILKTRDHVVVCGGTGLYIQALLSGLDRPPVPASIRAQVSAWYQEKDLAFLATKLQELDAELALKTDLKNPHRVQRLLEWVLAGKPEATSEPWPTNWQVVKLAIAIDRATLYERINKRVDAMLAQGLLKEVEALLPFTQLQALQTVGYQELFAYFEGKCGLEEAIEKIKQNSRNYAKRQLTWFKRMEGLHWLQAAEPEALLKEALSHGNDTGLKCINLPSVL